MGRQKDPKEWSPAYRARMERGAKQGLTQQEARRGVNSKEMKAAREKADELKSFDRTIYNLERQKKVDNLKHMTGLESKKEHRQAQRALDKLIKDIKKHVNQKPTGLSYYQQKDRIRKQINDLRKKGILPKQGEWGSDEFIIFGTP